MNILELLEFEEGYIEKAYNCSLGFPTIGIGKRIGPKGAHLSLYQFTVSKPVAYEWLKEEVMHIENSLQKFEWFDKLKGDRRTIIVSMAYQLGINGLLKFKKMIAAIECGKWHLAGCEMLDSKWANQTPERAERHFDVIAFGSIESAYDKV